MSTATSGRAREHRVRDHMQDAGWLQVARSAGSKGAADLVMVHPEHGLALVQVGTAGKSLGPADRVRLCDMADLCSALPILARVVPRQGIEYHLVARSLVAWERWSP
jgi:hypothetical protein